MPTKIFWLVLFRGPFTAIKYEPECLLRQLEPWSCSLFSCKVFSSKVASLLYFVSFLSWLLFCEFCVWGFRFDIFCSLISFASLKHEPFFYAETLKILAAVLFTIIMSVEWSKRIRGIRGLSRFKTEIHVAVVVNFVQLAQTRAFVSIHFARYWDSRKTNKIIYFSTKQPHVICCTKQRLHWKMKAEKSHLSMQFSYFV